MEVDSDQEFSVANRDLPEPAWFQNPNELAANDMNEDPHWFFFIDKRAKI